MASFNDFVFNVNSQNPVVTIYSLSAVDNSFVLDTITGTCSGQTVTGILYNGVAGASTANTTLSAGLNNSVRFRVHGVSYNQTPAALLLADGTSVQFTINTATASQVMTAAPTVNPGPNERRLHALEVVG